MGSIANLRSPTSSRKNMKTKQKRRGEKYTLSEVKNLGNELLSSRAHINNLPILLSMANSSSPPQYVLESLLSLQSFFTPLLPQLPSSNSKNNRNIKDSQRDAEFIYLTWLRSKFDELVQSLIDIAVSAHSEPTLREVVLDTIMEFVKVGNGGKFHSAIFHKLIHAIVESTSTVEFLLDFLESKYFKYINVRYFTYISLEKLSRELEILKNSDDKKLRDNEIHQRANIELQVHNIHRMLSYVPPLEGLDEKSEHDMWNGSGIFDKEHKKKHTEVLKEKDEKQNHPNSVPSATNLAKKMKSKFTKAWISFLSLPLPLDVYKEVLVTLHRAVIPHLSNPIILCDFLTRSYDIGGVISVMALSSLYILMTQHGLEYPNFYEKLYVLLEPSIFMARHRARFFQLLDSCLKSPLLPAYLAAAYSKKLSRLALYVPPSGALIITALIHNLLRRHPCINCLVHQDDDSVTGSGSINDLRAKGGFDDNVEDSSASIDTSSNKSGVDHFNDEESDPVKTNAMRSSLWEIDTLRHHYCPPVSRFVLSLENDLTVRAKTTEVAIKDFSSGAYATIFGEEIRRRVKQVPLAFYKATPTTLFSESDFVGWTFKLDHGEHSSKRQRVESP